MTKQNNRNSIYGGSYESTCNELEGRSFKHTCRRLAASSLSNACDFSEETPLQVVRNQLKSLNDSDWQNAIGENGPLYRKVWQILEG